MDDFKKFDLVYNKKKDEFGVVSGEGFKSLYVNVYDHKGKGPIFRHKGAWSKKDTIVYPGPDNLNTRLAIRIKYGQ